MNKVYNDAFVELTEAEVKLFMEDGSFRKQVIQAAEDVAEQTQRTVIIAGPTEELGIFNDAGFKPSVLIAQSFHRGETVEYRGERGVVHVEPIPEHINVTVWFEARPSERSKSETVHPSQLKKVSQATPKPGSRKRLQVQANRRRSRRSG